MAETLYKALVKDKFTGKRKIIESSYNNKLDFIRDLRANGYSVDPSRVKTKKEFDWIMNHTNAEDWQWKKKKYGSPGEYLRRRK